MKRGQDNGKVSCNMVFTKEPNQPLEHNVSIEAENISDVVELVVNILSELMVQTSESNNNWKVNVDELLIATWLSFMWTMMKLYRNWHTEGITNRTKDIMKDIMQSTIALVEWDTKTLAEMAISTSKPRQAKGWETTEWDALFE